MCPFTLHWSIWSHLLLSRRIYLNPPTFIKDLMDEQFKFLFSLLFFFCCLFVYKHFFNEHYHHFNSNLFFTPFPIFCLLPFTSVFVVHVTVEIDDLSFIIWIWCFSSALCELNLLYAWFFSGLRSKNKCMCGKHFTPTAETAAGAVVLDAGRGQIMWNKHKNYIKKNWW